MRIIVLLCLFACTQVSAETLEGKIVSVTDGDTITLLDSGRHQYEIRIAGIDAPERKKPYGNRSKQHLSLLAYR
jgi:endonuclease YncB( thermonuclease family)